MATRTKGEVLRDNVLLVYPEWSSWSRDLRRLFVLLPSYGVDSDAMENLCRDLGWKYELLMGKVEQCESFRLALEEYVSNGCKYRTAIGVYTSRNGNLLDRSVKWSDLQHVYMIESAIGGYIKGEVGKLSPSESKLVEKSGLQDIEPPIHQKDLRWYAKDVTAGKVNGGGGEQSLHDLADSIGG